MASHLIMSEEDVRQYFLENNGVVRNTDIVTHFRSYLSDPNTRDEARVLFKTYVNKLANVKTENGEKFLVLKPFYCTDNYLRPSASDNANVNVSVINSGSLAYGNLPPMYSHPPPNIGGHHGNVPPHYQGNSSPHFQANAPPPHFQPNVPSHFQGNVPPNYQQHQHPANIPTNMHLPPAPVPPPHFQIQTPSANNMPPEFPMEMEYGLPPAPNFRTPNSNSNRLPSPPAYNAAFGSGRLPPPYRPPPPPAPTRAPPPQPISNKNMGGVSIPPFLNYNPSSPSQHFSSEPSTPMRSKYPFHRSSSVTGGLGPSGGDNHQKQHMYFESPASSTTPAPPVPPRSKNRGSFEKLSRTMSMSVMDDFMRNADGSAGSKLENSYPPYKDTENRSKPAAASDRENTPVQTEEKISVKERLQKFNRIASESELTASSANISGSAAGPGGAAGAGKTSAGRVRREATNNNNNHINNKVDAGDIDDTASISSSYGFGYAHHMQPTDKEWILIAAKCDYHSLYKMAQENPALVRRKDINGYTALHWAAKHGNADLVKLLAGTFKSDINAKSNGGYTPLHLASQFSRENVYELLAKVYNADVNVRDHSGKKPMQYLVRADTSLSSDTFRKLKEKRVSSAEHGTRDTSFLRIGSLNVRVKKTTEAFGYFLGKSNSSSNIEKILHSSWGSEDNISGGSNAAPDGGKERENQKQLMGPPSSSNIARSIIYKSKRKSGSGSGSGSNSNSNHSSMSAIESNTNTIKEIQSDSEDSDTASGFDSSWKNLRKDL